MDTPAVKNTFPRAERLRGKSVIDSLFAEGSSGFCYPFRYVFSIEATERCTAPVSVLVSVPKRNHKRAVKRNLLKRRTREAWRLNKLALSLPEGNSLRIALVYSTKEVEQYRVIEDGVKKIIDRLEDRLSGGQLPKVDR